RPTPADCEERYFKQTLDHFRHVPLESGATTFQQRFFFCGEHWGKGGRRMGRHYDDGKTAEGEKGPIFFYAGNEADVTLYLEATGLMWENARDFGAALVFAEHRFYGKTLPFGSPDKGREYLGRALADYAFLISSLKEELGAEGSPVIAFGGSYGGML
ncbi:unnamed protein product, partial [Discosporangium mesarthrocarpum]